MKKNPVVPADIRDFLSADSINSFYFHYNIHDLLRLVCYGFRVLGLESAFSAIF